MTAKRSSHSIESGRAAWYLFIMIVRMDKLMGQSASRPDEDVALKREMGSMRCQSWTQTRSRSRTICQSDKWAGHCVGPRIHFAPGHHSILLAALAFCSAHCRKRILWRFGQENQNLVLDHSAPGGPPMATNQDRMCAPQPRPRVVHQGHILATNDKCIYFPLLRSQEHELKTPHRVLNFWATAFHYVCFGHLWTTLYSLKQMTGHRIVREIFMDPLIKGHHFWWSSWWPCLNLLDKRAVI